MSVVAPLNASFLNTSKISPFASYNNIAHVVDLVGALKNAHPSSYESEMIDKLVQR